jgi:hypothetical protein
MLGVLMRQKKVIAIKPRELILAALCVALPFTTSAHERIFTYSYEPATPPKGELEFEQHVTLRAGRDAAVGQEDHYQLEFNEEVEYAVTDDYLLSLYFNHQYEHFKDPDTGRVTSNYRQTGFSLENKVMVLNPTGHAVGLGLYLEPTYDGENLELEQKVILGQHYGQWRWAFNLTHATEWEDDFREYEGEFEASVGLAWRLASRWWLGIEARDHNEIPEYREWENTAVYLGPVVCYKRAGWFATLSVMPQIYGANFGGDPDGNRYLDLEGHERLNVRLIFGFDF